MNTLPMIEMPKKPEHDHDFVKWQIVKSTEKKTVYKRFCRTCWKVEKKEESTKL